MAKRNASAKANPFRQRILEGATQIGIWSGLCSNLVAEILAHTDFDWIVFDGEHAPNEIGQLLSQLQAMKGSPVAPIVRPAWNDPVLLKRLLDIGFRNFVVPYVQGGDEARAAVAATRYPPQGMRGVASAMRASDFGYAPGYHQTANDAICVIVQVETAQAVEALEDICAVDGVDAVFVGPSDLAASLGHLGDSGHPAVQRTIRRVAETATRLGTTTGILALDAKDGRRYLRWGYRFIGVASDVGLIKAGAASVTARFKG